MSSREVPGNLIHVTETSCSTRLVGIHGENHLTSECSSSKLHFRGSFQGSSIPLEVSCQLISMCVCISPRCGTGVYKPRVRCYDVNQLSMKFERCLDAEGRDLV